ncbi:hypothetical protein Leryth_024436 [Lithospermum erythrorhizon]|nr:hypothetical protein Leryth_024436 [Lithospermum erythrorhizon]
MVDKIHRLCILLFVVNIIRASDSLLKLPGISYNIYPSASHHNSKKWSSKVIEARQPRLSRRW